MSVEELFAAAGLIPAGPIGWSNPLACPERAPGVYAVVSAADVECDGSQLRAGEVLYVGKATRSIRNRLRPGRNPLRMRSDADLSQLRAPAPALRPNG